MIRIVVITGLSGSGKSTAIKALEDQGFYCVDNLPVTLLPKFVELCKESGEITKVGVVIDVRGVDFLRPFPDVLKRLEKNGHDVDIIFLESSVDSLVKRFSETRRVHPLAPSGRVLEGIKKEEEILKPLKSDAGKVIDTSNYNVHELKRSITDYVRKTAFSKRLTLNLISFGFKYGVPTEADIVMDVRFLPNPNFAPELKSLTGEEQKVQDYVLKTGLGEKFMERFSGLLDFLLPNYVTEGKSYLTVAIGCTGGRHRSVAIVEALREMTDNGEYCVRLFHRDKDRS